MIPFNIIVAVDSDNGIGKDGLLPWHIKGDMKRFKDITTRADALGKKNVLIMGRKTWESIPERYRPLADRINMVLSRNKDIVFPEGVLTSESFESAFESLESDSYKNSISEVFIIGGQKIFEEAIKHPECKKMYVTHIIGSFGCDTFFPVFYDKFIPSVASSFFDEDSVKYRFVVYQRV